MCVGTSDQLFAFGTEPGAEASGLGNIEAVNQARNTLDAIHLVQMGARASLVCRLTGLTRKVVSSLYPPLTGMPSPPGLMPFTDTWYVKSNQRLLHANVVWHLYRLLRQAENSAASVLIHVYEAYLEIVDAPILTLTRAFFVPRLVTINAWYEQTCDYCGMSYIGPLGNNDSVCPACAEYFNHRCRSCGTAIEYHRAGRHKVVCSECYKKQKRCRNNLTYGAANGCQRP